MLQHLDRVTFELSNRCNMAHLHPRCPSHLEKDKPPENISTYIVTDVLDSLNGHKFDGTIAFHQYGEPMNDPRLFWFLDKIRIWCPKAKTLIWTNGFNLDQHLLDDLGELGLYMLCVTAYSESEKKRFESLIVPKGLKLTLYDQKWIEVFDIYERPKNKITHHCLAPLSDLIITRKGKIGLCCRDWQQRYTFADLNQTSFAEALENPELKNTFERLRKGDRFLDICSRCTFWRDWRKCHGDFTMF